MIIPATDGRDTREAHVSPQKAPFDIKKSLTAARAKRGIDQSVLQPPNLLEICAMHRDSLMVGRIYQQSLEKFYNLFFLPHKMKPPLCALKAKVKRVTNITFGLLVIDCLL